MRLCCSVIVLLALAEGLAAHAQEQSCEFGALSATVRATLQDKYPGWKIVELSDLRSDDQTLWKKAHPGQCPGLAVGHFENDNEKSYAITLFKRLPKLHQLLVVVTPGPSTPML